MKFALFTSTENFVDEHYLIERIFECGADYLYVDKPNLTELQLEHWLLALPPEIREKSFICGNPNVASEFGLLGFHRDSAWFEKNQSAVPSSDIQASMETSSLDVSLIGYSQVVLVPANKFKGLAGVRSAFEDKKVAIFFAGDSDDFNLDALQKAGFDGVAVRSGVWEYADSISAWRRLCKK
ncbi:MAG: hypothetical protein M0P13_06770 [Fibrobacteraceae bacterium]|nr:hypothetical protein [Fibrobacteraceae bacterium]